MKLKTAMERYMFAAINARREYGAIKVCEPHINEDERWKESYEGHVRRYNFWLTALNWIRSKDRMIAGIDSRIDYIITGI